MQAFVLAQGSGSPYARKLQVSLVAANCFAWGIAVWGLAAAV